jgi:hypothetical protein
MQKEVEEIVCVCEQVIDKSRTFKEIAEAIRDIIKQVQSETTQIDAPGKSLALRKPLANLFILNSNMDDNIKAFEKIYDELKKI